MVDRVLHNVQHRLEQLVAAAHAKGLRRAHAISRKTGLIDDERLTQACGRLQMGMKVLLCTVDPNFETLISGLLLIPTPRLEPQLARCIIYANNAMIGLEVGHVRLPPMLWRKLTNPLLCKCSMCTFRSYRHKMIGANLLSNAAVLWTHARYASRLPIDRGALANS
eukprot:CAMPEP_0115828694 /NCGR_PEP_ID=MMETSP0287-20121206/706_1 /TAXON_ID=412157 /ORGANISM="Chrysochromulina rotalis, Strain UIO044" /LENGTH=165 /DNA_ID=CAMNT_0003281919 /DNA_START=516 /DNA_END=1014 /DNA_ORIENTATION=+